MKTSLFFSILFCALALPLCAQSAGSENTLKTDIAVLQTEIKNLSKNIDDRFDNMEKRFDSIEKNFDRQNNIIIACVAIPMAFFTILIIWRDRKDRIQEKQIEELTQQIEELKQPTFSTGTEL